jgi:hypothetical protein
VTCAEYEKQLQHLTKLATQPGWKAYVWHRLQELDQVPLFSGIKADAISRIESSKRQQSNGESANESATNHPA